MLFTLAIVKSSGQTASCIRDTIYCNDTIHVFYSIICNNCNDYALIKDTITGSYFVEEKETNNYRICLKKNVLSISFLTIPSQSDTIEFRLIPRKNHKSNIINFNGYFFFITNDNIRSRIEITNKHEIK